jgi:hypothetical protein
MVGLPPLNPEQQKEKDKLYKELSYGGDILMDTWDPQVWDFIENLRISHGTRPALDGLLSYKLYTCARVDFQNMGIHLARLGPDTEEPPN